jgi:peptidoglycan/LPS O-acetylase OafA/YrhL
MLLRVCFMLVLALVGLGQVAAIRHLVTQRGRGDRQLAALLLGGGGLLLVASFSMRWTPELTLPRWLMIAVCVTSVTAILCGVALLERLARRHR